MLRGWVAMGGFLLAGCAELMGPRPPEAQLLVEVVAEKITLRGQEIADAQALQTALMAESTLETVVTVQTRGAVADATLWSVLCEVSKAPASRIDLRLGNLTHSVSSRLDTAAVKGDAVVGVHWPGKLVLSVGSKSIDVALGDAQVARQARAAVDAACPARDCRGTLYLGSDTEIVSTLETWQRVFAHGSEILSMHRARGGERQVEDHDKAAWSKGKLEPEVIQRAIRRQYSEVRRCYEAGLRRNSKLLGLVEVRFVIDAQGVATQVEDAGSNLPDLEVRKCVLEQFAKLRFPPPTGGLVTVVYPIVLMPG